MLVNFISRSELHHKLPKLSTGILYFRWRNLSLSEKMLVSTTKFTYTTEKAMTVAVHTHKTSLAKFSNR